MTADEASSGFKVRALGKLAIRCAGHESMTAVYRVQIFEWIG